MIVIKPEFQGMGIGTKFMQIMLEFARSNRCILAVAEAIEAKGKTNSKRLLEKFGFVELYKEESYWGKLYPDFDCKECGQKPCICVMHKYQKKLDGDNDDKGRVDKKF